MSAGVYPLQIEQGSTFIREIKYLAADGITIIPLTGYSARTQIRLTFEDIATIISLTSSLGGGLVIDEAAGKITMTISATVTAALSFVSGVWDLEIVSPLGVVTRILQGNVYLSKEVTK